MTDISEKILDSNDKSENKSENKSELSLEDKLIKEITNAEEPLDALQLSRVIFGSKATRKKVNPTLYRMLSKKTIVKLDPIKGMKPRWDLNE